MKTQGNEQRERGRNDAVFFGGRKDDGGEAEMMDENSILRSIPDSAYWFRFVLQQLPVLKR